MKNFTNYIGLFTDHYEFTMAQGYFLDGRKETKACFDYFFRKNPFKSGYVIFAGLQDFLEMLSEFNFNDDSISHLKRVGFNDDFLDYLKDFKFNGKIYSVKEGEVIFNNEPVIIVEGNIIETQLIESLLLNMINFQSLIATKASRIRLTAGDKLVMEFGLRRAQGLSAIHASRAAIIGGLDSTSNVYSAYKYDLLSSGTLAHSWIQSYGDELTAFRKFASVFSNNCVLLVDTYNTIKSGLPNAVKVAKEMEVKGERLRAIRLDSGDLAYLSKEARKILDQANLRYVKIVASNQLNEYLIKSLIDQGAPIDAFGVGTNLITGQTDAALDGVYKLAAVDDKPTLKLSENIEKITLPGTKKLYRYYNGENKFYADGILLKEENEIDEIYHPVDINKCANVQGLNKEELLAKVFEGGKQKMKKESVYEIRQYAKERLVLLPEEHKRFENPHIYKVGISKKLLNLKTELIKDLKR
ncbi:MAG: nicotinate phosphoribosyltransferase [Ignavibacteriales bacterium CG_4_9_14_3_um_filter_30_11]|nr:MAG: nicotinate phosphoribosyltransferase [Ignavibacteriales bacterium CG_4_9_14_3_um_filter_30_11]